MLTRTIVAVLIIAFSALAPAGAEPRGENRGRAQQHQRGRSQQHRGRGRGWGQRYQSENPLGGFLGGILGGWLSNQLREDDPPQPNAPFYNEDEGDESREH